MGFEVQADARFPIFRFEIQSVGNLNFCYAVITFVHTVSDHSNQMITLTKFFFLCSKPAAHLTELAKTSYLKVIILSNHAKRC
jgi:hypothetical protein